MDWCLWIGVHRLVSHERRKSCVPSTNRWCNVCLCCCRMIPHKTKRGAAALERLKAFEGIPAPYDKMKRMVIPDALKWVPSCWSSFFDCSSGSIISCEYGDFYSIMSVFLILFCCQICHHFLMDWFSRGCCTLLANWLLFCWHWWLWLDVCEYQGIEVAARPQVLLVGPPVYWGWLASLWHHQGIYIFILL